MKRPKPPASLIVHEPVRVSLADLNFAPYNPRTISDDEMETLKASIRKHGVVLSLVVQLSSEEHGPNVIIGGHQRVRAVREICRESGSPEPLHVWSIVLDVDDVTAKQLNVGLNQIAGEFDPHKLGLVLADIVGEQGFSYKAIGFRAEEIDEIVRQVSLTAEEIEAVNSYDDGLAGFAKSITLTVEFPTVAQRDEAKLALKALAGGDVPGTVVVRLLERAKKPAA